MAVMRGIARSDKEMRRGLWNSPLFSDDNSLIYGSTLGILGFGRIGKAVCRRARGLHMQVVYYDPCRADKETEKEYGAAYLPFADVLRTSDCVTLHMPYTKENHHLFQAETFAVMKPSAYFINAARGKLVEESALCAALRGGVIKGAGLDVFEFEPTVSAELRMLENVVLTPHTGSLTMRSRIAMCHEALEGIDAVLQGKMPDNAVNPIVFKRKTT
jgi:lactate dehydrogenase-like 2-hydroxyacid dehydrogenase